MVVSPRQAANAAKELHNRHCDGRRSVQPDLLSTVAQFLSSLDSNRMEGNKTRLAAVYGECRWCVLWSVAPHAVRDTCDVFLHDVCFWAVCVTHIAALRQTLCLLHCFNLHSGKSDCCL